MVCEIPNKLIFKHSTCSGLPVLSVMAAAQGNVPQVAMYTSTQLSYRLNKSSVSQYVVNTPHNRQLVYKDTTGISPCTKGCFKIVILIVIFVGCCNGNFVMCMYCKGLPGFFFVKLGIVVNIDTRTLVQKLPYT